MPAVAAAGWKGDLRSTDCPSSVAGTAEGGQNSDRRFGTYDSLPLELLARAESFDSAMLFEGTLNSLGAPCTNSKPYLRPSGSTNHRRQVPAVAAAALS